MRIILRTMDLPGKSAALYRPRKSPIGKKLLILHLPSSIVEMNELYHLCLYLFHRIEEAGVGKQSTHHISVRRQRNT
jgi:hypothetical protein